MCGINGFNFRDEALIRQMNEATKHRGPDGQGVFVDEQVSIGHNLLAIADVPANSNQPVVSSDRQYVLSYNGEIYNYVALRKELTAQGDTFVTNSDTEVLFKGLLRHGTNFIDRLEGMFAFAWYDAPGSRIIVVRDRMGIKPLYYYAHDGKFIFSSELRGIFAHGIARRLDTRGAAVFFAMGYVPGFNTLLQNISKVPPGYYVTFDLAQKKVEFAKFAVRKELITEPFSERALRDHIGTAVREHIMGLRPFGLYLSGGLDSSIILHELAHQGAKNMHTYTTRFDVPEERYQEDANIAHQLARHYGVPLHEVTVGEQDFIDALLPALIAIEEPRYNYSASAYWLTARRASQDITVVLNGSGGDELFMGYSKYQHSLQISKALSRFPQAANLWYTLKTLLVERAWRGRLRLDRTLDRWMYISKSSVASAAIQSDIRLAHHQLRRYLRDSGKVVLDANDPDMENNIASFDRLWWLADEEFLRTDKITMQFGMEGRFPMMAASLIEYAQRIASHEKLSGVQSKDLMRRTYRGLLPDYVTTKRKTGWQAPVGLWMNSKLFDVVRDVLSPTYYPETASLFDFDFLARSYLAGRRTFTAPEVKTFWPIVSFQMWAKIQHITL